MTTDRETFEGWAIVELMGHRRLAGYVRQAEQFGVAMLRLDVPENAWVDGCTCGSKEPASDDHEKHDYHCQMFRAEDDHEPGDIHATQFYGGSSIYCLTPVTEEMGRAVAFSAKPKPVTHWELPRPQLTPTPGFDADTSEHDWPQLDPNA